MDLADEVVAARRAQQAKELVELEEAFAATWPGQTGDLAIIEVTDTGSGMPPALPYTLSQMTAAGARPSATNRSICATASGGKNGKACTSPASSAGTSCAISSERQELKRSSFSRAWWWPSAAPRRRIERRVDSAPFM